MNELEKLVNARNTMIAVLDKINDTIYAAQIVKEGHMRMFGFNKTTVKSKIIIYTKVVKGILYEIILDLTQPHLVNLHRVKQERIYGFEIKSLDEFRDILIFSHLI
jgi:hypothetical protein